MHKLIPALAVAAFAAAQTPSMEGPWQGTLEVQGVQLRLVLRIQKAADGGLSATIDSLDQGAMGLRVAGATLKEGTVQLDLPNLKASFEGKLNGEASEIAGQWTQGGRTFPLLFRRGEPAVATVKGKPITASEREYLISRLEQTRKVFLDSIAGLTESQWTFKAGPDRWSIAECAEHIAVSEEVLFQFATGRVLKIPPRPGETGATREDDEKIFAAIIDRSQKGKAPEPLQPAQRFAGREALAAEFNKRRARNIEYVQTTQDDLRDHSTPHPVFRRMDAYQYLVLMAAHSQRHTLQIEEVKAAPGYPK